MVPPDSLPQELTVPNLQIARGLSCVVVIGFVSSAVIQAVGTIAPSADLQANAP